MGGMKTRIFLLAFAAGALGASADVPTSTRALTEPREYVGAGGKTFRYRWHQPAKIEPGKKYPFVFLMHGAGERGTNNVSQLQWGAKEILDYATSSAGNDCFFLAGQVPNGSQWVNVPWSNLHHRMPEEPSETMTLQIELAEKLFRELPVDPDRVYATGVSMGGYGTWDLICRRPRWFAAAMPVCGGADVDLLWRIRDVAVWTHHGDRDSVVPFARSRLATEALWRLGGNVKHTEYPGVGHNSWVPAYGNRKNLEWLFAQRRRAPARVPFAGGDAIAFLGDSITQFGTEKPDGYVNLVLRGLAAGGANCTLVPAGVSGETSRQMLARLERDVLAKRPKWMFLSCGVNDAPNGYEDYRKNPGIPLAEYKKNVEAILDRAHAAGIGAIVLEPTPVVEEPHLANVNERPYVEALRQIARARKLPIVPLNQVFAERCRSKPNPFVRELTVDGTHMSPAGNRLMADVILATLGW